MIDASARAIFERNISEIELADVVLACIDNYDPGTIWEMGYAYGIREAGCTKAKLIAYTTKHHGLNLMLSESCDGFLRGYKSIRDYFGGATDVAVAWKGERT